MRKLDYYQQFADKVIRENKDRDKLFDDTHKADTFDYQLPKDATDRIEELKNAEMHHGPHDALNTAARIFSRVEPSPSYMPFIPNEPTREKANETEYAVKYWYWMAAKRESPGATHKLTRNAAKYGVNAVFVEHIEHMAKNQGVDKEELARRLQKGPFALHVYDPRTVYPIRDRYDLIGVVVRTTRSALEVIQEYGDKAKELEKRYSSAEEKFSDVDLYEYWDTKVRCTWVVPVTSGVHAMSSQSNLVLQEPMEHKLPFFPWVYESNPVPLLYAIMKSGKWKLANLALSLLRTDIVSHFAEATDVIKEVTAGSVEMPYGEPGEPIRLGPQDEHRRVAKSQIDTGLMTVIQMANDEMQGSSLSDVLKGGSIPAQIAFPTLRLKINTDMNALAPYMEITENALAGIYTLMLKWIKFIGETVTVMGLNSDNRGVQYMIDPQEIPDNFAHFTAKLHSSEPTDQQAKINAGMGATQLGLSRKRVLAQIGVEDAEASLAESTQDKFDQAAIEIEVMKMQSMAQMDIQAQQMGFKSALDAMMQAKMQTAQQAGGGFGPPGQGAGQQDFMQGPPPGPSGPGFDPSQGGLPPISAAPETTTAAGQRGDGIGEGGAIGEGVGAG